MTLGKIARTLGAKHRTRVTFEQLRDSDHRREKKSFLAIEIESESDQGLADRDLAD